MKNKLMTQQKEPPPTVRCSISFSQDQYLELERIAKSKKVSLAWVVREAIEKYLSASYPLFDQTL